MQQQYDDRQSWESISRIIQDQQRVSDKISKLIEALASDVGRMNEGTQKLAVLMTRVERLEAQVESHEEKRSACMDGVTERFAVADRKREENKDRITSLERDVTQRLTVIKDTITDQFSTMKEKAAYSAGKYGAVTALIVSIVTMILGWVISHAHK